MNAPSVFARGSRSLRLAILAAITVAFASFPAAGESETTSESRTADAGTGTGSVTETGGNQETGMGDSGEGENLPPGLNAEAALLARLSGLFVAEDPTSVYQLDVYDESVQFILDGSWSVGLEGSLDFFTVGGVTSVSTAPPVFTQAVNLSSWIFIANTWYFEADFAEEFTKNTLAFGYVGAEDSPVRHVRVGNSGISFPTVYPFIALGGADRESGSPVIAPGAMGTFGGENWRADAMIRYDAVTARTLLLSGMNEAQDTTVFVGDPVRGKYFALPERPVSGTVRVWAEDPSGDALDAEGRRWRRLNDAEFTVDGLSGTITLDAAAKRAIAVSYSGAWVDGGGTPGSSLLGFVADAHDWLDLALSGNVPSEVLPDPGSDPLHSIPFTEAVKARFIREISGETVLLVSEKGRFSPFEILSRYDLPGDAVELVHPQSAEIEEGFETASLDGVTAEVRLTEGLGTGAADDPSFRYPLARRIPSIYVPPFSASDAQTDLVLRSRVYIPITEINLGTEAIPGTIVMTRNGIAERSFAFDPGTGILVPDRAPGPTDTVRIDWFDSDASARNATLSAAAAGAFNPVSDLALSAGTSLQWNISKEAYTDASGGSPGSWLASVGAAWKRENLSLSTAVAFELAMADTTGLYRVVGMDSSQSFIAPASDWYRTIPDDALESVESGLSNVEGAALTLGQNVGRIATSTDESVAGSVLSLGATFADAAEWAGADILSGEKGSYDIRNAAKIELSMRNTGTSTSFDLYLQSGAGDTGYREDADAVATWKIAEGSALPAKGNWKTLSVEIAESDRTRMGGYQNLRLVVVPTGALPDAVSLQSGPIRVMDAFFTPRAEPAFDAMTTGIDGFCRAVGETGGNALNSLDAHSSDIVDRLNPGGGNSALAVRFLPDRTPLEGQTITVSRPLNAVPLASYRELSFELEADEIPTNSGARIVLSFFRPASDGSRDSVWKASLPVNGLNLSAGAWRTVSVNLDTGRVISDGLAVPDAQVTSNVKSILPSGIEIAFVDWPEPASQENGWVVRLDEIRLEENDPVRTITDESAFSWSHPGRLAGIGKIALLSSPKLSVTTRAARNLETGQTPVSGTSEASLTLAGIDLRGSLSATSEVSRGITQTAHAITFPLGFFSASEEYAVDFGTSSLLRLEKAAIEGILPVTATARLSMTERLLTRENAVSVSPTLDSGRFGLFPFSFKARATQAGSSPVPDFDQPEWGSLWSDTLGLMGSTGETDASRRGIGGDISLGWNAIAGDGPGFSSLALTADASESYARARVAEATRASRAGFSVSAPFRLSGNALTPTWKRSVTRNRVAGTGGNWQYDAESLGASLAVMPWLHRSPPISDLVSSAPTGSEDPLSSFAYLTGYSLTWDRPAPGTLADLWTPVSVNASIARRTETGALSEHLRDERTASVRASFSALNVAGRWGMNPVFDWYDQDEISQMYGWSTKWGEGYRTWTLDAWDGISLYYGESGTVSLDNQIAYTSVGLDGTGESLGGTLKATWRRPAKDSPIAPIIRRFTELGVTAERQDSLSWIWRGIGAPAFSAEWTHALVTRIGQNGEITLSGGTSWFAENERTSVGLRLSLGGTLKY